MTVRDYSEEAIAAYEAGDLRTLFKVALRFAKQLEITEELQDREAERKRMHAERQRAYKARSDDITARQMTSGDISERQVISPRARSKEQLKAKQQDQEQQQDQQFAPAAPLNGKRATAPHASWVSRLTALCRVEVGDVEPGYLGKRLKSYHEQHGEQVLETAMSYYATERKALGKAASFKWFMDDIARWIVAAKDPLVVDGELTPLGERLTRPLASAGR